ncbi:oligosaccharide flippase family protein [bacterium]|nr:oligosaccharide flippase family protein [bacterium]
MKVRDIVRNIFLNPKSFFLENLGVKQTIAKNTFWLAVAEVINKILRFIFIIYVVRILGATEYGKFTFGLAFVGLFGIFSDLGVSQIVTREIAKDSSKEKELPAIFSLKLLLTLITLFLILIGSFFITQTPQIQKIILILAFLTAVQGFSSIIFAFFNAKQRMEYQSFAKIFEVILLVILGFFVIFHFPSAENLSYVYLTSAFLTLVFVSLFFHFKILPIRFSFNFSIWKTYLLLSWPLALSGVIGSILGNTDSTMMGYFGQITQTGWYNAAQRIVATSVIPANLIAVSFFPALSKFFSEAKEKLQTTWNYYAQTVILFILPLIVGGIVLAPKIINFVYGANFQPAILAFRILIICGGVAILSGPLNQVLLVSNQQKKVFFIGVFGALVNVSLNFILIPKYSLYGAALTSLVAGFLILFLLFKLTSKLTPVEPINSKLISSFLITGISVIPMYFAISQPRVYNLNVIFSILIGAAIYSVTFLILKTVLKYSI